MRLLNAILLLAVLITAAQAEQEAVTKGGKTVILRDDGTWTLKVSAPISAVETFHFRRAKWGASPKEVKATEDWDFLLESDEIVAYQGRLADLEVWAAYIFIDSILVRAKYAVQEKHSNKNLYVNDYRTLKNLLTQKYGVPLSDQSFWDNDLYKGDPENLGMAVSVGHLSMAAQWKTKDTEISVVITGDNYKIQCQVEYASIRYSKFAGDSKKTSTLDDL